MNDATAPSWLTRVTTTAAVSVLLWIARTLLGLLVAYPLILAVRASGMISGPQGDAVLFQPGSLLLLELLRVGAPWLGSALKLTLLLAFISALIELLPLACALDWLWLRGDPLAPRVTRAISLFPRFLGLSGIALLTQAALLLAGSLLGALAKSALHGADERLLDLAPLALMGLGVLASICFGSVLDIARAALVQDPKLSLRGALARAVTCLSKRPWAVLLGAYPSVAGALLAFLCAAWLMLRLDLSGPSHVTVALAFGVHQLAVLFAIVWRVRWLATALELSAER